MSDLRRVGPRLLVDRERVTAVVGDPSEGGGGPTIIYVQEGNDNNNNSYVTPWTFLEVYTTLQNYNQGS